MPNRMLYATARQSKKLAQCSAEEERLYWRLVMSVDDFGLFHAEEDVVASTCFPRQRSITEAKIRAWLEGLADRGLLVLYEVDGDRFLQMTNWNQRSRAKGSAFPSPDGQTTVTRPSSAHEDVDGGDVDEDGDVTTSRGESNDELFERFWKAYPVEGRRDKPKVRKLFLAAIKADGSGIRKNDPEWLIAAAERYAADPNRGTADFQTSTKYAQGWLSGERWNDPPLEPRGRPGLATNGDRPRAPTRAEQLAQEAAQARREEAGNGQTGRNGALGSALDPGSDAGPLGLPGDRRVREGALD